MDPELESEPRQQMDVSSTQQEPQPEHPLQHRWSVWKHRKATTANDYGSNMTKICTFNTVEGFWRFMNYTPAPSDMFTTEQGPTRFGDRDIEGISVFKKDVHPEWEDPRNMHGGEFFIRKTMTVNVLDQWWEDLLMGIVGETVDPTEVITGVRVVDKSSKGKVLYRFEVWFECNAENDPALVETIKENICQALNANIKLEYRSHSNTMGGGGGGHESHGSAPGARGHHGGGRRM
jgi:translation initiation factor 4E